MRFHGRLPVHTCTIITLLGWSCSGQNWTEPAPADGFRNNLGQPTAGIAGSNFVRASRVHYQDGAYQIWSLPDRPNPMEVSMEAHNKQSSGTSAWGRNALLAFYAQLILDEVSLVGLGCPPEYENLPVPTSHPLANHTQRPQVYQRSAYDQSSGYQRGSPRQQVNQATSFLDGGVIYGPSQVWTSYLRELRQGKLLSLGTNPRSSFPAFNTVRLPLINAPATQLHQLKPVDRLFRLGNPKGHENPFLLALQVVWFRWHNLVADRVVQKAQMTGTNMTDHDIFLAARRTVIAHFQKIVVKDWLPAFVDGNSGNSSREEIPPYTGYNPRQNPGVGQEFLAAMDWRYTITPAAVWLMGNSCNPVSLNGPIRNSSKPFTALRLCANFWDPQETVKENLDTILRGLLFTSAENEDGRVVPDLIESFYGPFEYSRLDRMADLIQRHRDHGLPGLNDVRQAYGLPPLQDWTSLGGNNGTLHRLYGGARPDSLDILTGGLLDQSGQSAGMSQLFRRIILDQMTSLRNGDRFWYQRPGAFTPEEMAEIENVTFKTILAATTNLSPDQIPDNPFLCQAPSPCPCLPAPDVTGASSSSSEACSQFQSHDYFQGSQVSFALSWLALALVTPVSILVLLCLVRKKHVVVVEGRSRKSNVFSKGDPNKFTAREYLGKKSGYRDVTGEFQPQQERIVIYDTSRRVLRYANFQKSSEDSRVIIHLSSDKNMNLLAIKVPGDIDLILALADHDSRQLFMTSMESFLTSLGLFYETELMSESNLLARCSDKDQRQALLDKFFRAVCLQIFEGKEQPPSRLSLASPVMEEVLHIQLTLSEFADALGLQPSSLFVRNMFMLANKDQNQFLSFQEFLDLFAIFLKGTAEQKSRLIFNIYDVQQKGKLTRDEFHKMIKSLLDMADSADLTDRAVQNLVSSMFSQVGLKEDEFMTLPLFQRIFCNDEFGTALQQTTIVGGASKHVPKQPSLIGSGSFNSKRTSFIESYSKGRKQWAGRDDKKAKVVGGSKPAVSHTRSSSLRISARTVEYPRSKLSKRLHNISRFINVYKLQIFWAVLYTLVTVGIFAERAYFFSRGREHAGLRRLSGAWVTACIRGSASVIMFTYSSLLVTMCRNLITALRETFLHRFIPFDSAVNFHKFISVLAIIGTVLHVVTHAINLYCMCTQSTSSINCFFTEYYTASDSWATFHFWGYQTITGLTGILVTILVFVMYVFATQYSRRHVFKAFWATHSLYWLVYVLTFLHGVGRLVQAPLFAWYLIGPLLLFVIDRLQSVSRNKVEIAVVSATQLPSDVLRLVFQRPSTFSYRSGQWVRIACTEMSKSEYHPFTLTSAPHETYLSLHIRAVGPWTTNLRKIYSPGRLSIDGGGAWPKLYLDGPFGEGHQEWYNCDVAVLVGGGIGVTPFASILKDIAFKSRTGMELTCKKVYFVWVTRTQKSFEWLVDIIRQCEKDDVREVVETHIFVTQFQQKFDLRTAMLYICERHFQKVEGQSLFTGLKAVTHFGRPQFEQIFLAISQQFSQVSQIGVFSCGPGPMTSNVQSACQAMNGLLGPTFTHHFENF